jgi:hypothetical protein
MTLAEEVLISLAQLSVPLLLGAQVRKIPFF